VTTGSGYVAPPGFFALVLVLEPFFDYEDENEEDKAAR
jgi:hypothetical protein